MAWTYGGDPTANNRDEVRFLLGDTDTNDQQVSDAEVAWAIAESTDNYLAAARLAEHLAAKYSRYADERTGEHEQKASQLAQSYRLQAAQLRAASPTGGLLIECL